ncbi:MAG: hypothetical protein HYS08_08865 [Chlamydiae bacterium]|nr:hypothetical protein [Chlamydiota bacterium]MBI3265474.1 hypothetical protein [Chlamydiota bacterium]
MKPLKVSQHAEGEVIAYSKACPDSSSLQDQLHLENLRFLKSEGILSKHDLLDLSVVILRTNSEEFKKV